MRIKLEDHHLKCLLEQGNLAQYGETLYMSAPNFWYKKEKDKVYLLEFDDLPIDVLKDIKYAHLRDLKKINKILNEIS